MMSLTSASSPGTVVFDLPSSLSAPLSSSLHSPLTSGSGSTFASASSSSPCSLFLTKPFLQRRGMGGWRHRFKLGVLCTTDSTIFNFNYTTLYSYAPIYQVMFARPLKVLIREKKNIQQVLLSIWAARFGWMMMQTEFFGQSERKQAMHVRK